MPKFVTFIVLVIFGTFIYFSGYFTFGSQSADILLRENYPDGLHVIPVENYGYAPILKSFIDNATSSIFVATLELSDYYPVSVILDSLIKAHNRGVDVKVLYEGDISSNKYGASYLRDHGVDVKNDSSPLFLHTKLVIVDSEVVYVGSHNWSPHAFEKNNEYGVFVLNSSVGEYFTRYFNSLWSDSNRTPDMGSLEVSDGNISMICTYDGYTYHPIKDLLESASNRLYVAMYTMGYYTNPTSEAEVRVNNLVDSIVSKREISSVVLDDHDSDDAYNYLTDSNVDVRKDSSSFITHLKLVVSDDSVYVGDTNWDTYYIDNSTHTVGVVIRNSTVADFFAGYFKVIQKYGDAPYYIADPMLEKWYYSVLPGENLKIDFRIANGGYKNQTTFHIDFYGDLNAVFDSDPSFSRNDVYEWYAGNISVDTSGAQGLHSLMITYYSQDYNINISFYIVVNIVEPVPEFIPDFSSIMVLLMSFIILGGRRVRKRS